MENNQPYIPISITTKPCLANKLEAPYKEASVAELMKSANGVLFWDVSFFRGVHARELEAMSGFMDTTHMVL